MHESCKHTGTQYLRNLTNTVHILVRGETLVGGGNPMKPQLANNFVAYLNVSIMHPLR